MLFTNIHDDYNDLEVTMMIKNKTMEEGTCAAHKIEDRIDVLLYKVVSLC